MQLMPQTAKALGVDPMDVRKNIEGGAKYLRSLLQRYNNDSVLALAAYNAGPSAVSRFSGVPPYLETRRYIEKVLTEYEKEGASRVASASSAAIGIRPSPSGR
jgi:soluble lytic murein transglycosylase-like protein